MRADVLTAQRRPAFLRDMLKLKANYTATQARFQQKQLQEKEQKLLQLYDQQQQRAYQVVQRSSAGSNGSTIRTTTTTHSTSTSQGGKVRQMFDERRQTTVKGIDRSYPLEPLENKLRKQAANTNGLATQRNGNLTTVNRQSVNVKRVARADVNSNVNGGKPVVSYREEVTRESFGPSIHHHDDEDEFGAENRVANGHHRRDLDNEEEELDQETIDRNRMMAKIHLMGYDESLKHRVRNDLESEEFPEYLMMNVSDKLPKRSVTKKLTQAEARLERFKNANAKRSNNNTPKQSTTISSTAKRRTEQMLPARSNSRGSEIADGTSSGSARSGSSRAWERGRGSPENWKNPTPKIRAVDRPYIADGEVEVKTQRESPDVERLHRSDNPRSFLRKTGTAGMTWRSYSADNYYKSLSSDGKIIMRRGASPQFRKNMDFRAASADRQTHGTRTSLSTNPKFFCKEGERSATTMLIDREGSASSRDQQILTRQSRTSEETAMNIDRKYAAITRSQSPRLVSNELGRSDATVNLDRKNMEYRSVSADRHTPETRASRSTSPEFFYRKGETSATTMMNNERARRPTVASRNREILTKQSRGIKEATTSIDGKYAKTSREKRFSSPPFFLRDSGKSGAMVNIDHKNINYRSASVDRQTREIRTSRSTSPEFFCKEGERSATTMLIDRGESASSRDQQILTRQSRRSEETAMNIDRKYAAITRSQSPRLVSNELGRSDATVNLDRKNMEYRSVSADRHTPETRASRSTSPEFFCRKGETSAATMMNNERARRPTVASRNREILTKQSRGIKEATTSIDGKYTKTSREKRFSSPPFSLRDSGKSSAIMNTDYKNVNYRSASADRQTRETRTSRSTSPEFFCKEGERSATTMLIDRGGSASSHDQQILTKQNRGIKEATTNIDRKYVKVTREKRSSSPPVFLRDSEKSSAIMNTDYKNINYRSASADRQTRETRTSRSTSPEFFCKEGERSATTMLIDREGSASSRDQQILTRQSRTSEETTMNIDRKYAAITRSQSPRLVSNELGRSDATVNLDRKNMEYRSVSADRHTPETRASRSTSPEFFYRKNETSATTMINNERARRPTVASRNREILTKQSRGIKEATTSIDGKYVKTSREKRFSSPPFFLRDSGKSGAMVNIDDKNINYRSASADRQTRETRTSRSTSPEFFCKEGERSATTMLIDRGGSASSHDQQILTKQNRGIKEATTNIDRKYVKVTREKRSSSPPFFLRDSEKSSAIMNTDYKNINYRSASVDRQTRETRTSRSTSPEFFCKEGERSATTMLIDRGGSASSRDREILTKQSKQTERASTSIDRKYAKVTHKKLSSSPRLFRKESGRSITTTLIEPKSSSVDTTKNILKRRKYTSDASYKQHGRSLLLSNRGVRSTRVRHTPSPPITRSEAKRTPRRNEVSNVTVKSGGRKSSKISDISATSASSIVSLKYGLEFDNILQSTGLVRKFMKSQNGGQRGAHHRSPLKRNIKSARIEKKNGHPRNRYKVSPLFQKSRSPSADSRGKTTPEFYSRKSVTPTEFDVEIQEITMTDHRMERYKPRKSSSPEQSRVDSPTASSSLRKIIPPKRDCGRQHGVKSKTPPRFSPSGQARCSAVIPKTMFSQEITDQKEDQDYTSKYATYTIKSRKRQNVLVARKGSPDLSDGKVNMGSKSEEWKDAKEFSKAALTQREAESKRDIGKIESLSVQESAARRFDSVTAGSEHSTRASPEISLRTMDTQTKAPVEKLNVRSASDFSREVKGNMTLRSTLRTSTGKSSRVGKVSRKGNLKAIPSTVIRSSRRITKTYRSSSENKVSTQKRSPTCKRQLFESDSEKEAQKGKQRSFTKMQKRENYYSADVRSRKDQTTSKVKSLEDFDVTKRSRSSEEASTISVKPLRSIEDIRKSIGCHKQSALSTAKRSRSAVANWRSSTSRKSDDMRRSCSVSEAARRADEPARLIKTQSCVSRIAKSPSPDASARKQHETNARATQGSAPSSPSKSPDMHVAPKRGFTEPKQQDAKPTRRSIVAKAVESIGSKTTAEDAVDGVVEQHDSPYESSAKKSDAFVIDLDDRPKESDTTSPKKVTPMRRSTNDKNQTSSASGRPTSSISSNFSSVGTTQSQASSKKSRMATRAKMPVSSGSQARGPSTARNVGNTNSTDNLMACNTCGRNFAQDRISLHEQICAKTMNKKRKQFDAMTFRVKGTELEAFAKKGVAKKQESHAKKPQLKSNWRRKHEEFIEAIRSAKMVQSHLAAGGNLRDLPPPPPSDTSDYIQCPHCGRKFNQAAAERHIPKCEHMLHNKPAHARMARPRRS